MIKSKIAISEKLDHSNIFLISFSSYFLLNLNSISRFSLLTFISDLRTSVACCGHPVVPLSPGQKYFLVLLSLCAGTRAGAKIPGQTPLTWDIPEQNNFPQKNQKTFNFAHLCHFQKRNSDCPVPSRLASRPGF